MVQLDTINTTIQEENVKTSSQPSASSSSSEQRLDQALTFIEDFLVDQSNHVNTQQDLQKKEAVLANLDILISRVQDILQQAETVEE